MRNKLLSLVLTLGTISSVFAEDQVTVLEKGQVSPFKGLLFPEEAAKQLQHRLVDLDYYKALSENKDKQVESYKQLVEIREQQATIWKSEAERASKDLVEERSKSRWQHALYFLGGATITTLLAFAVNKATR
jgi:hypothetical protein